MAVRDPERGSAGADPHADDSPAYYGVGRNGLVTLPIAALLLLAILFGTSAFIHGQLLSLGGDIWQNYNMLRVDMPEPGCDPNMAIDARLAATRSDAADEDSLFDATPSEPEARRRSLERQRDQCRANHARYQYNQRMTSASTLRA